MNCTVFIHTSFMVTEFTRVFFIVTKTPDVIGGNVMIVITDLKQWLCGNGSQWVCADFQCFLFQSNGVAGVKVPDKFSGCAKHCVCPPVCLSASPSVCLCVPAVSLPISRACRRSAALTRWLGFTVNIMELQTDALADWLI